MPRSFLVGRFSNFRYHRDCPSVIPNETREPENGESLGREIWSKPMVVAAAQLTWKIRPDRQRCFPDHFAGRIRLTEVLRELLNAPVL